MRQVLSALLAAIAALLASEAAIAQNAAAPAAPLPGRTTISRSAPNIPPMDVDCNARQDNATGIVRCVIRFNAPAVVTSVAAVEGATNAPWTPSFQPFDPQSDDTAFFVLVDRTDRARARTVRKAATDLERVFTGIGPRQRVAVASFATDMVLHQNFTSDPGAIRSAFGEIRAGGTATELYRHTLDAIRRLQAVPAARRVLVIAGTGNADDTAIGRDEVEQAATRAGVRIVSLGYAEREADAPAIQMLERLSERSQGVSYRIRGPNLALPEEFSRAILTRYGSGGVLEATRNPGDVPDALNVTLKFAPDNRERTFAAVFKAAGGATTDASATTPRQPQQPGSPTSYFALPQDVSWPVVAAATAAAAGLIFLGLLFLWRRSASRKPAISTELKFPEAPAVAAGQAEASPPRPPSPSSFEEREVSTDRAPQPEPGLTRVAPAGGLDQSPPIAYLEFNAPPGRFPVRKKHLTIGRHPDNDVVTDPRDDTVSRRHAVLAINSDGRWQITNRSNEYRTEKNPISVKGEIRDIAVLSDGDSVRLGTGNYGFVFRETGRSPD